LKQIAPGLRRWLAWHAEWSQEVSCVAVDTDAGLTLIDPLETPPEVRHAKQILLTVFWHSRTTPDLDAEHVWAPSRSVRRLKNRGVDVTDPFEPGDELPGGIRSFATARDGEVVYYLPKQKALVVGDVLLGAGAKPHATSEPLRLCPENWLEKATHEDLRESLQPLLDLPIEIVLPSHGDPVLSGGKQALAAII
jgi:glyoxylase-like metal-dependent hydrolase (beta-lactamase superfamily II)